MAVTCREETRTEKTRYTDPMERVNHCQAGDVVFLVTRAPEQSKGKVQKPPLGKSVKKGEES